MKGILTTIAIMFLALAGRADVLWWLVDDNASVDGNSVYSFVSSYGTETDEDGYTYYNVGARVSVTFSDGRRETLPIVYHDFPGESFDYAEFFDGGGANNSGFGTGWWTSQSPFDMEICQEAMFQVELGKLSYNEVLDVVEWTTLAKANPAAVDELTRYIFRGGVNVPADDQWTPTNFHTVPEPSTALLCLLGLGMLALRRK